MGEVRLAYQEVKVPGARFGGLFISVERLCELHLGDARGYMPSDEEAAALAGVDLGKVIHALAEQIVAEPDEVTTATGTNRKD